MSKRTLQAKVKKLVKRPVFWLAVAAALFIISIPTYSVMANILGIYRGPVETTRPTQVDELNIQPMPNTLAAPGESTTPQQSTAAPQTTPKTTSNNTSYKPGVCTETIIPKGYKEVQDPTRYVGNNATINGYDGRKKTCTADSNGYVYPEYGYPAVDTVVYIGTKPLPDTSSGTIYYGGTTYDSRRALCGKLATYGDTSAYEEYCTAYGY